jgi:signal transduction histidine kinase
MPHLGQRMGLALGEDEVGLDRLLVGQVERLGQLGAWQWTLASGQVQWSGYLYEMFGRDPAGSPVPFTQGQTLFTSPSWPRLRQAMETAIATGGGFEEEAEFQRPAGGTGWVIVRGEAILDAQGRAVRLFGTVQDITWRKQAQQELSATRAMLDAALASMGDSVWLCDAQGKVVEVNDAFVRTHRFRDKAQCVAALAAQPQLLELSLDGGEPAGRADWPVARALRGEVGTSVEYALRRRDTGERWVMSYSFGPVRDRQGQVIGAVVTGRDITAFRQMQSSLEASRTQLQQLLAELQRAEERERQRIARELHDDLQQLLGAIRLDLVSIGQQPVLVHTPVPALLERTASIADLAIEAIRRIVSDLRPQILDDLGLVAALQSMVKDFEGRTAIGCALEVSGGEGADMSLAPDAATCLYRIAQEALNNVQKHAQASFVHLWLDLASVQRVSLHIEDNGKGIDPEDLAKGSSFGLQGMGERARALGGSFSVQPGTAGGTSVQVVLPRAAVPAVPEPTGPPG